VHAEMPAVKDSQHQPSLHSSLVDVDLKQEQIALRPVAKIR